jgi:VWFA-related protein
MSHRVLSIVVTALCCTAASAGQQTRPPGAAADPQTPNFRLQVEYVEVDVRVTDSKGHFVRDLTKDDFQILEDGKPQTVAAFSLVDIPIEPSSQADSSSASIEPDVRSNERRFDGRVYVMMLDDGGTRTDRTTRTKNAARRFIQDHLGPDDLMAIAFTFRTKLVQEFTSDKRRLLAAVDKFMSGPFEMEPPLPLLAGPGVGGSGGPLFTLGNAEGVFGAVREMANIRKVAAWLDRIPGRKKAVVLFSDGNEYDTRQILVDTRPSGEIGRTNVSIYAVDMRGPGAVQAPLNQLNILAEDSGGFVVMDNPEIDRGFRRIVAENSSYYLLAYYSSHPRDDKFHRIDVRVTRPRVTVQARRGYMSENREPLRRLAAANQVSEGIIDALRSPVQLSNLRMRVFAAPFRAASNASVLLGIELAGRDLPLETNGTVEISYVAIDAKGSEHGWRTDRLRLNLQPATRERVEQSGVIALKRIELPAGRYRLQIAASDPVRSVTGSVISDLEVPDFKKAAFAMSGLLVTSRSSDVLTAYADEQLKDVLPAPPIASRTFPQDDEIAAFAEIYDDNVRPHQVDIVTTVRSAAGAVVFEETEARESSELQSAQDGIYRHVARIPLTAFEPGPYVLSLEARSRLNANLAAERRVPFTVTATEPTR